MRDRLSWCILKEKCRSQTALIQQEVWQKHSFRKPLIWMGRSRKDLGELDDRVKGELGYGLDLAQAGEKHENASTLKRI